MPKLFYCDHHEIPLPDGHKFPIEKYRRVREILGREGTFEFEPAPFAEIEDIKRVHDSQYVDSFLVGALSPAAYRRIGFPASEGLIKRTLASVGGTLAATRLALQDGWGGNLAGGTHHAFRAEGSGFCVFNDIAVAILWARLNAVIERSAVIDLDVHQGDGTAEIFKDDASVLTLSLHGKSNFPFRKQQSSIDVALEDKTGDEEYLRQLQAVLPQIAKHGPEIVFYQAGVDGLASDTLGKLALTLEGLKKRDRMVFEFAADMNVPFVIVQGGGYSKPSELTAQAHANVYSEAALFFARQNVAV
ncbi:MAG: histone deacetylase [Terriglobales bacterium]|jgi:acetoin utilization deacetylase AcuC-like enzyme